MQQLMWFSPSADVGIALPAMDRLRSFVRGAVEQLEDYSQESTLHGLSYIFNRQLPWGHRVAWLLAMAAALLGFSVMVKQSYDDLQRSPIITFDSYPSSTRDVPPPALSVCRRWFTPRGTSDLIMKLDLKRRSVEEDLDYKAARALCERDFYMLPSNANYSHVWDLFARLSGIEITSSHHQENESYGVYPHRQGFCVTVNMLGPLTRIPTLQTSWAEVLRANKVHTFARKDHLWVQVVDYPGNTDDICNPFIEDTEYQVHLHDPRDYPGNDRFGDFTFKQGAYADLEWFVKDAVEPLDEVASVPLHRRKCFYPHDAPRLRFFNHYTPGNCLAECEWNNTLKLLDCLDLEWRIDGRSENICGYGGKIEWRFLHKGVVPPPPKGVVSGESCDCLQLCSHVVYGVRHRDHTERRGMDVQVYRKIHTFTKKIRSVVITDTGFVANCAGLLGLFLGVSVLSVFEVVYHVVVRASGATTRPPVQYATSSELQQLRSTLQEELRHIKSSQHLHQKTFDLHQKTHDLHQKADDQLRNTLNDLLKKMSRYADDGLSKQDSSSINVPGNL